MALSLHSDQKSVIPTDLVWDFLAEVNTVSASIRTHCRRGNTRFADVSLAELSAIKTDVVKQAPTRDKYVEYKRRLIDVSKKYFSVARY